MIEIFNKPLLPGSLVLYMIGKGDMSKTNLGIVVSKCSVFGIRCGIYRERQPKYVYLIENPDEKELFIKNDLSNQYINMKMNERK